MTRIFCFSGSGHSESVARELAEMLACEIAEIGSQTKLPLQEDTAVVIFPVYCQNIPKPAKAFMKALRAKHIVLIATYGRISHGNVLQEAQKLVHGEIIAGAYLPMGHTFLDGDFSFDREILLPIAERIQHPRKIRIPKCPKNLLSNLFPGFRSRISVEIRKNGLCNDCGICEKRCPMAAMKNGRVSSRCIRCLRCVAACPQRALSYQNTKILKHYLHRYYRPVKPTLYL